ncbi:MAG: hypothetical protein RI923_1375 [Pseudomonadota bacterium]
MMRPGKLQEFQQAFSGHLRSPGRIHRPIGVPKRAADIYSGLLFNNICGFIDACFPVARSLMSEQRRRGLCRRFFSDHASHTPYFSRVPEQFVNFVNQQVISLRVPAWMPELLHYEWIELEVDTAPNPPASKPSRLLTLDPSVRNLRYDWPVHKISPDYRPRKMQRTYLLVHRNRELKVCFLEINEVTAALLSILEESPKSTANALSLVAGRLGYPDPDVLHIHGRQLLADFINRDIVIGKLV